MIGLPPSVSGVAQVLTSADPLPDFDLHAPLGSLPLATSATVTFSSTFRRFARSAIHTFCSASAEPAYSISSGR